jgi:hypothetical protein
VVPVPLILAVLAIGGFVWYRSRQATSSTSPATTPSPTPTPSEPSTPTAPKPEIWLYIATSLNRTADIHRKSSGEVEWRLGKHDTWKSAANINEAVARVRDTFVADQPIVSLAPSIGFDSPLTHVQVEHKGYGNSWKAITQVDDQGAIKKVETLVDTPEEAWYTVVAKMNAALAQAGVTDFQFPYTIYVVMHDWAV